MDNLSRKKILIISPEPWRHNFISKHHYALSLARLGNTVFFLNPPSAIDRCSATYQPDLYIIEYSPFIRGVNRMPERIAKWVSAVDVKKILALAQTSFDIIWSFDPFRLQYPELFRASVYIYFAADWHAARKKENVLADHSHVVLSPSRSLLHLLTTKTAKYFVNHGVADYFFNSMVPMVLPGHNPTKVGYVGNLHSKFLDHELLADVILQNNDSDFIFVGDDSGCLKEIREFDNVFFLGERPNDHVPSFLKACDILLLCYNTERYRIEASNSHKVMEYLSSGKAVVTTRLEEYVDSPELVHMPRRNSELPVLLQRLKQNIRELNSGIAQEKRREFAAANTYNCQLDRIDVIVGQIKKEH